MRDLVGQQLTLWNFTLYAVAAVVLLLLLLGVVSYTVFFHRKIVGWIQGRIGPNRTGPWGLLQSIADVLKLLLKEDIIPKKADRALFVIAPVIAFAPAFIVFAIIPFSESLTFADIGVGVLYYVAIASITTLGVIMGGWASNNKFALIGGMRSAAQMISYEIPLIISMLGVVLLAGSMNLNDIVESQRGMWNIFPQFIGFVVFFIASMAELNRSPFDLSEAESELIAGNLVEYSGFRFAFFMLAEYTYVFVMAGLAATLFLGGWLAPFGLTFIPGFVWFILKMLLFAFTPFWFHATFPRIRMDQLMGFAWKVLLPLSIFNILLTAVVKEFLR